MLFSWNMTNLDMYIEDGEVVPNKDNYIFIDQTPIINDYDNDGLIAIYVIDPEPEVEGGLDDTDDDDNASSASSINSDVFYEYDYIFVYEMKILTHPLWVK